MNNSFDLQSLVRPNVRELSPYSSARSKYGAGLLLDANENSLGAPWIEADGLHRYPDPAQASLREAIAEWRGVRAENIFTGTGSDEAIDLLVRIFGTPGKDNIIITPPTYGMYRVAAEIQDLQVLEVPLDDSFEPAVDAILEEATPATTLLFLCSPNNPTGNLFPGNKIERLLNNFNGIVVIDEAYIDFSGDSGWSSRVVDYPNLVVLQTMSKSFGLAGIRLGTAFASGSIIEYFMKIKPPYNINALTGKYAQESFNHLDTIHFNIEALIEERERLRERLIKLDPVQTIYPSDANFLLVKMNQAMEYYRKLAENGVIVRYRGNQYNCDHCLRITVGTPDENDQLVNTLKEIKL